MTSTSEIKTQLWTAASRLQRAQSKFEHLAQASRKDITSVITRELQLRASDASQDETEQEKLLTSARLKAEKLIMDDEACDLMGMIERYCDVLLEGQLHERTAELDQDCLEAVSGILSASSRVDSPELHALSHSLARRYPDLISESDLRENISLKLVAHLNPGRPSQTLVDTKLVSIAQSHGLSNWAPPELLPADRTRELTWMLEHPQTTISIVDEQRLRHLCSHAVPADAPPWARYRAWSILLGILPRDKSLWSNSEAKGRTDYAALSQQLLRTLSSQPPFDSSMSIAPQDKTLLQFTKDVEALPASIRDALYRCVILPSSPMTTAEIPGIEHADAVATRISMLKNRNRLDANSTQVIPPIPTITLGDPPTSPFSPTASYSDASAPAATVLLSSSPSSAQSSYDNILLRLLYLHSMLHSSHSTSFGPPAALAAIFAVVLTLALQSQAALSTGAQSADTLTSVEAGVFWMVQAIVGNTRELLEGGDEGDEIWTRKFSNIVRWADSELWTDLSRKGLDPALPYYSYRWIPTLFTHTLPLQTLLPIWDAIFSASTPNDNTPHPPTISQAEFVYAIGATMLIRARAAIFQTSHADQDKAGVSHNPGTASPSSGLTSFWKRQGKGTEISLPHSPSPYSPIASPKTPQSPTFSASSRNEFLEGDAQGPSGRLTPGRLSSVFLVAVKLLQEYDVDAFGGIERLLGSSWSLWRRWCREGRFLLESPLQDMSRLSNLADEETVSQTAGTRSTGGVTAGLNRLRDLAWKGITNEVDDTYPSSPMEPEAPSKKAVAPKLTVTSPGSEGGVGAGFFSSISGGLGSKLSESVWKGVTNQIDSPDPSPEVTPEPSPTRSSILVTHDEIEPGPERAIISSSWAGEGAMSWAKGYAEKLKASETAANLTRTGTTLRAKASIVWARNATQNQQHDANGSISDLEGRGVGHPPYQRDAVAESQSGALSPATSSVGSWSEMFSKRGSLPLVGSLIGESRSRDGSESSVAGSPAPHRDFVNIHKRDSYSPPAKPSSFRSARDSVMGSIFSPGHTVFSPDSPHPPNSPPTAESSAKNPLQAALAALSGSAKVEAAPKRGPKPLLLNSGSLITPSGTRSGLSSRTPSRRPSPSPTPTPRAGDRFSLSTEGEDVAFNTSGFVSLRRGPLTNPRTAGYGVTNSSREGNHSSRTSTSSGVSSPAPSAREFSLDLESEEESRGRVEGTRVPKRGFLVDHGRQSSGNNGLEKVGTSPLPQESATAPVVHISSSDEHHPNNHMASSVGANPPTKLRSKRHPNRPAPIATDSPSISAKNLPELMVTTPRSGENLQQHVSGTAADAGDLTGIGTPVSTVGGATLNRSRSSTRRVKKPRRGSSEGRTPKAGPGEDENRNSMLSVGPGESEEEGARADIEDMDDIYDMY